METFFTILILLLTVSLSGVVTRIFPFQIPLPLMQIIVGAVLAWPQFGLHIDFNPELFLMLFIPPLLFADGWKTPAQEFLHYGREILCLALVLVIITVVGVGYLIHFLLPSIPLAAAFALAAVLSPTDAVALSGIVGKGRMPKPVMRVIEGEALMNDASGLVSLNFSIAVALGAMTFTLESAFLTFLQVSIGGVLCGIIIVFLYNQMVKFIHKWMYNDSATQIIFSLLLPFSCYLIAERFGVSGILAAVSAGMMIGQSKVNRSMPLVRLRTNNIWEMLEFVFNGMVFILLGLQLPGILNFTVAQTDIDHSISLETLLAYVVIIYFSLIAVRLIWLWLMKVGSVTLMRKDPLLFSKFSTRDLFVAAFAGVRGAVTLPGVLSIPLFLLDGSPFPGRYQLVFIASGVILLSIVVGIVTLPFLLRGNLPPEEDQEEAFSVSEALASAATKAVNDTKEKLLGAPPEDATPELIEETTRRMLDVLQRKILTKEDVKNIVALKRLERQLYLASLHAEREELYRLRRMKKISHEKQRKLLHRIDITEVLLSEDSV
ncbi:Na+/H+ antiporter [Serratia marcescens]|uniref:Na+/H+ antiporter n=1 Tax=Serratia marcescens TaxID=615 RepID=UPI000744F253|nr:Na+/H+ antiporter [Serratia marcescens]CUY06699.1 Sodium%2C potassium%2C lithium and rubidium/H(+) antiporter [Serratia marcescens]CUY24439.1 Sodium%2C potassium%2C lithium and rubidium/H(+) antiporter [Serratia marcescens]CUZ30212.1 Sodium%2C potassium%2C lithium and rubidium/H(+) antiporter [Serratia marcescens]CUZ62387.1 Sodium%2C potassium%2C lithium and rubidium/H(+) antiporter [Serratia marcescens]CVB35034.1 Sodium%2C potassium%2C lithium and rubidium/H(+) antiporter [Serratia marcesc